MLFDEHELHPTANAESLFPNDQLLALSQLSVGEAGIVQGITLEDDSRSFVARFGFVDGAIVSVVRRLPLGGLRVYRIGQAEIALRPEMAEKVLVIRNAE